MKRTLLPQQIEKIWRDGYLLLNNVVSADILGRMASEFEQWKEESRGHAQPFGTSCDNRPRFDVEPGHCAEKPALRRIASPIEISETHLDVMRNNSALDAVAEIIGPNIRFNNALINSGSACLMHTRLVHGSGPNLSGQSRTLFICEYCAEDSYPLQANSIPSRCMEAKTSRCGDTGEVAPGFPVRTPHQR